jgi:hypothetical protein
MPLWCNPDESQAVGFLPLAIKIPLPGIFLNEPMSGIEGQVSKLACSLRTFSPISSVASHMTPIVQSRRKPSSWLSAIGNKNTPTGDIFK